MTKRTYKIGHDREQVSLLPKYYVGRDNPVRAIDAYVEQRAPREIAMKASSEVRKIALACTFSDGATYRHRSRREAKTNDADPSLINQTAMILRGEKQE
jgi:hypothetical protein